MDKKYRKWINPWTFQLTHTNFKILSKIREILRRCTTVRRWHLENLCGRTWQLNWPGNICYSQSLVLEHDGVTPFWPIWRCSNWLQSAAPHSVVSPFPPPPFQVSLCYLCVFKKNIYIFKSSLCNLFKKTVSAFCSSYDLIAFVIQSVIESVIQSGSIFVGQQNVSHKLFGSS